ncbi:MAG TPA: hypothetical protein VMM83_07685 [Longimicrobiales bacterium]|nr:hypothetical protein [Longimicrobiales bacterium]
MTRMTMVAMAAVATGFVACGGDDLDTRTYELSYLQDHEATRLVAPYVYTDRENAPGSFEVAGSAMTVRETMDNLEKIERMLAEFDVPQPLTMLHFQIIRADGATAPDPAIAEVERELRRLFRFEGYELLAETRVGVMEGAAIRQAARGGGEEFLINGGALAVRSRGERPTITLELELLTDGGTQRPLQTQVTIPAGHAVVVGTLETAESGALILVVRAEVVGTDAVSGPEAHDTATPG